MTQIDIATGRPYSVLIGKGLLGQAGELAARVHPPCALALVMDDRVAPLYGEAATAAFAAVGYTVKPYVFPHGEGSKNMERLSHLLEFLAQEGLGRSDLIAALGGGVTGDLAGFAAAVYQRGTGYIQLPTTLLAACDSSVGGKTAVNLAAGKNLAGAFWQPKLVVCDWATFDTLPREELAAGAAECVKYALLGDPQLLRTLTEQGLDAPWGEVTRGCVRQKADIVERDEEEQGLRQLLNLGHTLGHAAEKLSGYTIRHGEGVAMGLTVMTRAAENLNICPPGLTDQVQAALAALGLPTSCPYDRLELATAALGDKKRQGDEITLVFPTALGECALHRVRTEDLPRVFRMGWED